MTNRSALLLAAATIFGSTLVAGAAVVAQVPSRMDALVRCESLIQRAPEIADPAARRRIEHLSRIICMGSFDYENRPDDVCGPEVGLREPTCFTGGTWLTKARIVLGG